MNKTIVIRDNPIPHGDPQRFIQIDMDNYEFDKKYEEYSNRSYSPQAVLIQDVFPNLSPAEREFIKMGTLPEDIGLERDNITVITREELDEALDPA